MSSTVISKEKQKVLHSLFNSMNLTKTEESDSLALSWLERHQKTFYGYLNACWLNEENIEKDIKSKMVCHKICDPFSEKHLCNVYSHDVTLFEYAAKKSALGFEAWSSLSAESRSKILNNISRAIKKYADLFSIIEALSTSKHLYKVKKDVLNLIESFSYYAGCALNLQDTSMSKTWFPAGPVCVIAEEYNNPSLTLSLRVGSALASGNSVLLLTDAKSSLSSFLLAEICTESGMPPGVLNVIPIDQANLNRTEGLNAIGQSHIFSKLIFTGTFEKCVSFSKFCVEAKLPCDFLISRRPVIIVYENADLHSAANGVIEAFLYHDVRSKSGGCKVMIQESIHEKFLEILKERFYKIQVGSNLSKTDCSCLVTNEQKEFLTPLIKDGTKHKGQTFCLMFYKKNYTRMLPMLFANLQNSHKLVHEELGGPIAVAIRFRTVKESISMFNCDNKGSPVSIWTEISSVALEAAMKLKSGVIWINSENVIDARTAFTGVYLSGNSFEGGQDAIFSHMSILPKTAGMEKVNAPVQSDFSKFQESPAFEGIKEDRNCYKLYIGGKKTSSAKNTLILNESTRIFPGTESDVLSAISSALAAQPKWEAVIDLQIRGIFSDIMDEMQKKKRKEFVTELVNITGNSVDACEREFNEALFVLYHYYKYGGQAQEIKNNMMVLQYRKPLGVIGIQCPDEKPLLSFVSLVIPAIACGNTVVAIASTSYPTIALKMCEAFTSANVPGGVINVIWGDTSSLVPTLHKHADVNALWYTDVPSEVIYNHCNVTQRLFHCNGMWEDINEAKRLKCTLESTYTKSVFLPVGETYAN